MQSESRTATVGNSSITIRHNRATELFHDDYYSEDIEAVRTRSLSRYLAVTFEQDGKIVELHQSESLDGIVALLENTTVDTNDTDTVIHDLDNGDVLRPNFQRVFRILAVYKDSSAVWTPEKTT